MRLGSAGKCGVNSTLFFSARPLLADDDRISNALPLSSTARVISTYVSDGCGSANTFSFSPDRRPSRERDTSSTAAMSRPEGPC
eukprot:2656585-Pleurochrysis_carterae.AAC.2